LSNFDIDEKMENSAKIDYLRKYGESAISYTTIQPDILDLFEDGLGYVSYARKWGANLIVGDPICSVERRIDFLRHVVGQLHNPSFVQVNAKTAAVLDREFGYKIVSIGVETELDVQEYQLLNDPKKRNLRSYIRKGEAQATVEEATLDELESRHGIGLSEIVSMTEEWQAGKTVTGQLRFLLREHGHEPEPYVRKFYSITPDHRLMGYVYFNPMFRDGEPYGYCADAMRSAGEASKGHVAYIIMKAMEAFRAEGKEILSLGLSPCYGLAPVTEFSTSRRAHFFISRFGALGNRFFNLRGIAENKRQYRAREVPVYMAFKRMLSAPELLRLIKCIGLI
jgi:phosphatidylglycerol lysyltransferase